MKVPTPCGPLSETVAAYLTSADNRSVGLPTVPTDQLDERDRELALWMMYELSYRSFDDVDDDLEWDVDLLALRGRLEHETEQRLRRAWRESGRPEEFHALLESYADAPSVAGFIKRDATWDEAREILVQKSIYHLKESDPQAFVIARLEPAPKAALVELLFDEFGDGRADDVHAQLFADALESAGLDHTYGAYIDDATAPTLAISNAMSLLCLRQRLRYAAMGHLAAFEATSSLPCKDFVRGFSRLGFDDPVIRYFDEHVEADAVHEQLARHDICSVLTGGDATLEAEVVFGAFICLELEARSAAELLRDEAVA
jgi:hypothetical protein